MKTSTTLMTTRQKKKTNDKTVVEVMETTTATLPYRTE
jgi:hypothetical protein